MRRDEALQHFQETFVQPQLAESLAALYTDYQSKRAELQANLSQAFAQLCQITAARQAAGQKNAIAYLYGSFLYSSLCRGESLCRLDAYDQSWFLDQQECSVSYPADWAFGHLHQLCERLAADSKQYIGQITRYDIKLIKREQAWHYSVCLQELGQAVLGELFSDPAFQAMNKADEVAVYIGEYKDRCQKTGVYRR